MENNSDLNPNNLFTIGSEVEVTSESTIDGFGNSWYRAKIIKPQNPTISNEHYWIQYYNLVEEDDHSQALKEQVHASLIRPLPPINVYKPNKIPFELNDVVEAFHEDGWWVGVVKEVKDQYKYLVSFASEDEIIFRKRKLRIHLDWIDGKWINPRTKDIVHDNNGSTSTATKRKRGRPSKKSLLDQCFDLPEEGYLIPPEAIDNKEGSNNINAYNKRGRTTKEDLQSVSLLKTVQENGSNQDNNKNEGAPEPTIQCLNFSKEGEDEVPLNLVSTEIEAGNGDDPLRLIDNFPDLSTPISTLEKDWPFSKSSTMWKMIDGLDIFKKIPVMPHFYPLQKYNCKMQEKLAIEMMIKFAYEAERILALSPSKLCDSDTINDIMDSLKDLKSNGFDTMTLEEHLRKLFPQVYKERELREKLEKIETKIIKCEEEKDALEIEMIQFVERMKTLKRIKDEELARLDAEKCVIVNEIRSLEFNFPVNL